MKRAMRLAIVIALGSGFVAVHVLAQQPVPATQPAAEAGKTPAKPALLCPVTGKPIDRTVVARFRGKWVYLASADAKKTFEQDPFKYADGVQAQWQASPPLRVQVKCPVTGERPSPDIYTGEGDDAVFFGSEDAKQKWLKDSQPFQKRFEAECFTYQTDCTACGGEIKPAVAREVDGRTIYFCCDGCAGQLAQDKAGCLKRVDEQIANNRRAFVMRMIERQLSEKPKKPDAPEPVEKSPG